MLTRELPARILESLTVAKPLQTLMYVVLV